MKLPEIIVPQIELAFEIPLLAHSCIVHFLIALPIIILILELLNLMMKKKAVGGVSFFLLILTVIVAMGAYFSLLVDAKESSLALSKVGQALLNEHSLLGTYLMLGSMIVFVLKLFAFTGKTFFKLLYVLGLIALVVGVLEYAKEAKTLVYEHGMNVAEVQVKNKNITKLNTELEQSKVANNTLLLEVKSMKSKVENIEKSLKSAKTKPVLESTGIESNATLIQNRLAPQTEAIQ